QILTACRHRLLMRLGDRSDHASFGVPPSEVPDLVTDRAIDPEGPRLVQIARPARGLAGAVAAIAAGGPDAQANAPPTARERPTPVGVLPERVHVEQLISTDRPAATATPEGSLSLIIGVSDHRLAIARLVLPPAAHALVAGPPRSGRTTTLRTVARA